MTHKNTPSLLDKKSRGGDIALVGLEFQKEFAIYKIPFLLSVEGFTSFILEAMGDIDIKYFSPEQGTMCEQIEVKDHVIKLAEFKQEIENFKELDEGSPNTYRSFTICGTGFVSTLQPLKNGLKRLKDPQSFYEKDSGISKNSLKKFKGIVNKLGLNKSIAKFIWEKVELEDSFESLKNNGKGMFISSFQQNFSSVENFSGKDFNQIYNKLRELIDSRINKPIFRWEIKEIIISVVGEDANFLTNPINLVTLINQDKQYEKMVVFNWKQFFGGVQRHFPLPETWDTVLMSELLKTKKWILDSRSTRYIKLKGSRRLSTSFAIGYTFSAVSGFNIVQEYRGEIYSTDDFPDEQTQGYQIEINIDSNQSKRLAVIISIMKNEMVKEVKEYFCSQENVNVGYLEITSDSPIINSKQANQLAQTIKENIKKATVELGIIHLDIFFAGPSYLALFLGHRWNAMPKTQCYEWVEPNTYVKTCFLE